MPMKGQAGGDASDWGPTETGEFDKNRFFLIERHVAAGVSALRGIQDSFERIATALERIAHKDDE